MTGLHRTPLTTSQKVDCAAQALAGQEAHGTLSELSRQFGVSRPTLYQAREVAGAVLTQHFARDEAEHQAVRVTVDEAQLRRTIVALRVMAPNAIRPIEELLPILYPGVRISYGKVQSILAQAEDAAGPR
jgi:transposase-like protein